ncbi:septal ring lytic transglycosylase RlpA family protein [Labilibaculum sp.]|uniref:septal ring lytic transglycosylase RlpA family protein n=1 Tax=Labilibaculum sp. TaxID=2060723 RepID=UPI0035688596
MGNNKAVIVRINDRGPFTKGRIIDLSKSAIKEIGNINEGVFAVSVEIYQKDFEMIPIQYISDPIPFKEEMLFVFE